MAGSKKKISGVSNRGQRETQVGYAKDQKTFKLALQRDMKAAQVCGPDNKSLMSKDERKKTLIFLKPEQNKVQAEDQQQSRTSSVAGRQEKIQEFPCRSQQLQSTTWMESLSATVSQSGQDTDQTQSMIIFETDLGSQEEEATMAHVHSQNKPQLEKMNGQTKILHESQQSGDRVLALMRGGGNRTSTSMLLIMVMMMAGVLTTNLSEATFTSQLYSSAGTITNSITDGFVMQQGKSSRMQ